MLTRRRSDWVVWIGHGTIVLVHAAAVAGGDDATAAADDADGVYGRWARGFSGATRLTKSKAKSKSAPPTHAGGKGNEGLETEHLLHTRWAAHPRFRALVQRHRGVAARRTEAWKPQHCF